MINEKKSVYIIFLFSLYVYSFTLLKYPLIGYIITYFIPLVYILLNANIFKTIFNKLTNSQFIWIMFYVILILLSIALPVLYSTNDFSYIKTITFIMRKLIVYLFLMVVIIKRYKEKASIELFMYYYCWATMCYVSCTLLMIAFPSFKNLLLNFVSNENQNELLQNFGYATRIGWMGFSGFRATLKCSISICFLLFLVWDKQSNLKIKKSFIIVSFLLSLLGNAFYGRIGVVVSIIIIIISLLIYKKISIFSFIKILFVVSICIMILIWLKNYSSALNDWYIWMSTPFKNLFKTGSFNNKSVEMMTDEMLFLPRFKTIMIGDAWYTVDNHYYMKTDLGFMRNILFWGLPGLILSYSLVFIPKFGIFKKYKNLLLLIFISFLIMEYKGEVYYEYAPLLFTFSCLNIYLKRKYSRGE